MNFVMSKSMISSNKKKIILFIRYNIYTLNLSLITIIP